MKQSGSKPSGRRRQRATAKRSSERGRGNVTEQQQQQQRELQFRQRVRETLMGAFGPDEANRIAGAYEQAVTIVRLSSALQQQERPDDEPRGRVIDAPLPGESAA